MDLNNPATLDKYGEFVADVRAAVFKVLEAMLTDLQGGRVDWAREKNLLGAVLEFDKHLDPMLEYVQEQQGVKPKPRHPLEELMRRMQDGEG